MFDSLDYEVRAGENCGAPIASGCKAIIITRKLSLFSFVIRMT